MSIFGDVKTAITQPDTSFVGKTLDFVDQNKDSINNVIDLGDKIGLWDTEDVKVQANTIQNDVQAAYMKRTVNDYKPYLIGAAVLIGTFAFIKFLK